MVPRHRLPGGEDRHLLQLPGAPQNFQKGMQEAAAAAFDFGAGCH